MCFRSDMAWWVWLFGNRFFPGGASDPLRDSGRFSAPVRSVFRGASCGTDRCFGADRLRNLRLRDREHIARRPFYRSGSVRPRERKDPRIGGASCVFVCILFFFRTLVRGDKTGRNGNHPDSLAWGLGRVGLRLRLASDIFTPLSPVVRPAIRIMRPARPAAFPATVPA